MVLAHNTSTYLNWTILKILQPQICVKFGTKTHQPAWPDLN